MNRFICLFAILSFLLTATLAQSSRVISGIVVTAKNEAVVGATVIARSASGDAKTTTDAEGNFNLTAPIEKSILRVEGKNHRRSGIGH